MATHSIRGDTSPPPPPLFLPCDIVMFQSLMASTQKYAKAPPSKFEEA